MQMQGVKRSYFLLYSPIFWGSPTFLLYFRVISYILLYFHLHMIICYLNRSKKGLFDYSNAYNFDFCGPKILLCSFSFHFAFTSVEILFYNEYLLIIMGSLKKKIARAFGARIFASYFKILARVFDAMLLTNYCSGLL